MPETITAKARRRLRDLYGQLGSTFAGVRENAFRAIDEWLRRHGKTWNDLHGLLQDPSASASAPFTDPRDGTADARASSTGDDVTSLDLIRHMIERYVGLEPYEAIAATLWVAHAHVCDRFMVTPRLLLLSPVRECGKTTLLDILSRLVPRPEKSDHITPAAIYHAIHDRYTLLIDEADNLDIATKGALRSILNSGHRRGGSVSRVIGGERRRFSTFAPLALASIGGLPLPLMSRCIVINMTRRADAQLRRYDGNDEDLDIAYAHTLVWARDVKLNPDLPMPADLRGRLADNWRPLIAIADACGREWGALARDAAERFARDYYDEDIAVLLLQDIRQVFDARSVDRLFSKDLVEALRAKEDAPWCEWRGPHGSQQPRPLSQNQLAAVLRLFNIRPRSIWPPRGTRSFKGYHRHQFEAAWAAYCGGETDRPAERGPINQLRGA